MQAGWGFIPSSEVQEFLMMGRPVRPWAESEKLVRVLVLTVVLSGGEAHKAIKAQTLAGPLPTDSVNFSASSRLPLRAGCLDCLLVLVHEAAWQMPTLQHLPEVAALLSPRGLIAIVMAGRPKLARLAMIEQQLTSLGLSIVTLRHFTAYTETLCGERVLAAGKQVMDANGVSGAPSFTILQVQRLDRKPTDAETVMRRLRGLVDTSEALDRLPDLPGGLGDADWDFLRPPQPPKGCFLHLCNYYDEWRQFYPELQVMLDNFDVIAREADTIASWTAWPEYHFREGGQSDWKVFPLMHTFPATDARNTKWIKATCEHCPQTVKLLRQLPRLRTALFSRLGPTTKLSAHTGWEDLANAVLRCHLTIKSPPDRCCGLWVEGEVRYHREKEFIIFDDSKIHKAFNLSPSESRVVLILDLLRPTGVPGGVAKGGHTPELDGFISAFG